jgi:hypothetical protein
VGRQKGVVEENPVVRFARVKRKYTKKDNGMFLWKYLNNFNSHSHYIMKMFYVCFVLQMMLRNVRRKWEQCKDEK